MSSLILDIADAVVAELNAGPFGGAFTAARDYRPRYTPAELQNLRVTVVPRTLTVEAESRSQQRVEAAIDIAVQKRLETESAAELDPLMDLVDQIVAFWPMRRPAALPEVICTGVENDPIYAVEHLDELRVFTSVVSLVLRVAVS